MSQQTGRADDSQTLKENYDRNVKDILTNNSVAKYGR